MRNPKAVNYYKLSDHECRNDFRVRNDKGQKKAVSVMNEMSVLSIAGTPIIRYCDVIVIL